MATNQRRSLFMSSGALNQISNLLLKADGSTFQQEDAAIKDRNMVKQKRQIAHFYEEFPIVKEEFVPNYMTVSVRRSNDADKKFVNFETDLPGDVIVHWGVCKDDGGKWEVPPTPHPPATKVFRHRALQTLLQVMRRIYYLLEIEIDFSYHMSFQHAILLLQYEAIQLF